MNTVACNVSKRKNCVEINEIKIYGMITRWLASILQLLILLPLTLPIYIERSGVLKDILIGTKKLYHRVSLEPKDKNQCNNSFPSIIKNFYEIPQMNKGSHQTIISNLFIQKINPNYMSHFTFYPIFLFNYSHSWPHPYKKYESKDKQRSCKSTNNTCNSK